MSYLVYQSTRNHVVYCSQCKISFNTKDNITAYYYSYNSSDPSEYFCTNCFKDKITSRIKRLQESINRLKNVFSYRKQIIKKVIEDTKEKIYCLPVYYIRDVIFYKDVKTVLKIIQANKQVEIERLEKRKLELEAIIAKIDLNLVPKGIRKHLLKDGNNIVNINI